MTSISDLAKPVQFQELLTAIKDQQKICISGGIGSQISFWIKNILSSQKKHCCIILEDKEQAAYIYNDLQQLLNDKEQAVFYPSSYRRPYEIEENTQNANILLRAEVLNRISKQEDQPLAIVTYPDALFEKVIAQKELQQQTLSIKVEDTLSLDFLNEVLFDYEFKRVEFVSQAGEFSVRGGIVDVFSFSYDQPFRIEFFGDEVESIRSFDIATQLSVETFDKIDLIANISAIQENNSDIERINFLEYINFDKSIIVANNIESTATRLDWNFNKAQKIFEKTHREVKKSTPESLFIQGKELTDKLKQFCCIEWCKKPYFKAQYSLHLESNAQTSFNKQINLLIEDLNEYHRKGYQNTILCATTQQIDRFREIFQDHEMEVSPYKTILFSAYQGFIDHQNKKLYYTDHQIFERYHKFKIKNGYAKKEALSLKALTSLEKGDYVTHIDHGIGKFGGLQKVDVDGNKQEAIKLIYGEGDVLYVSIHSLHKITKFNGKDGKAPTVHKLGSKVWKTLKQKTKSRVRHIAYNLIELYAKRRTQKGFAFDPDSYLQHELEASFIYEDTPDQHTATIAVKEDMEKDRPMDRLICGDVGFGKTEVAIRAAFKAVDNNKQVAVLVPTTILAFQHAKTFRERLKDFPVKIDYLNRFRTAKEKKEILEKLEKGELDIIIGTHQITNKKIKFKDLGLLIIDEEQKFGVAVKDKLKTLKENIDTLTLTATPIPRTLQFSLMAARDLSTITTPPPNRYPIDTQVVRFNEELIRDAVMYEMQRSGQVYFIHNRIENIKEVAGVIQRLVPDAKIAIGHGQLESKKLEEVMLSFMSGEFDVLVATTIIESGLDVPNANTIFINTAQNFGLSDLHQMRGRVGRSNKKAFCYFITPPYSMMSQDARKRMTALEQFSELGSGFKIAMKDLEIRGAGDLLGGEQSGFINDIGFETYQKILNEAVKELKENEFSSLYEQENQNIDHKEYVTDVQIDTDFELLFPDDYINSITERLNLYQELNTLTNIEELKAYQKRLEDRFGVLPQQAKSLITSLQIKWLAKQLGMEKLVLKQKRMIGYFVADQQSDFYNTKWFSGILKYVQENKTTCVMKQKETRNGLKLLLTFIRIESLDKAYQNLQEVIKCCR